MNVEFCKATAEIVVRDISGEHCFMALVREMDWQLFFVAF